MRLLDSTAVLASESLTSF